MCSANTAEIACMDSWLERGHCYEYEEEMMIRTEHLSKSYGEKEAVCDLTLEIRRGEIFGLLGPNGAGKTTTTLMLLGLTEPTGGSAYIDGKDCARQAIDVKRMVGYLPDNVGGLLRHDRTGEPAVYRAAKRTAQ